MKQYMKPLLEVLNLTADEALAVVVQSETESEDTDTDEFSA